jgi:hypothetical protein
MESLQGVNRRFARYSVVCSRQQGPYAPVHHFVPLESTVSPVESTSSLSDTGDLRGPEGDSGLSFLGRFLRGMGATYWFKHLAGGLGFALWILATISEWGTW